MYTVHNASQARLLYNQNKNAMFSCWCKNMDEFNNYEAEGIPWSQIMAYVGPKMKPEQQELYTNLHKNNVLCMISVSPTHDKADTDLKKIAGYKEEIITRPDVIETDYPYLFNELNLKR